MTASLEVRPAQDSETPATPVFATPIRHPSAWTVADFRSPPDYSIDLDAVQLRDIADAMRRIKAAGIGLDGLQREHFEVLSLRPVVEEILRQIKDGRGFVLLRGLPVEEYSKDELGLIFWGIGTHLGRGLSQSVMGDRLGHVKDFSREDPGARAYRNKQELSPHTDSCDLVGLLCLRNAQAGGGVSRLTSAISVHNTLLAEHPDVLAALYRGYVRHRRGEEQPGELPYTPYRVPVAGTGQKSGVSVETGAELLGRSPCCGQLDGFTDRCQAAGGARRPGGSAAAAASRRTISRARCRGDSRACRRRALAGSARPGRRNPRDPRGSRCG